MHSVKNQKRRVKAAAKIMDAADKFGQHYMTRPEGKRAQNAAVKLLKEMDTNRALIEEIVEPRAE